MAEKSAEIRIVKKKKGHTGHHGGAWKVAYADFVTAMMAFFLVMWIVGLNPTVKQAIEGYFKDPEGFMKAVNAGKSPFQVNENAGGLHEGKGKSDSNSVPGSGSERAKLEMAKKAIEKLVESKPEFKELGKHIDIKLVPEGLRIDLLEAKESLFFDSGSAKVKPATVRLLSQIASELKSLPNKVILEGHTDSLPLNRADGYTNWELSADRANGARSIMGTAGVSDSQIAQVRGYAATQPRDPQNPTHFSNRRVSILVLMSDALQRQQFGESDIAQPDIGKDLPVTESPSIVPGVGQSH